MKYAVLTFGCKVNQYESTAIDNAMRNAGFVPCTPDDTADVFIINSCSVTENSDKKAARAVRAARSANPDAIIVLTGCFPQAFPAQAEKCGADIIAGTAGRSAIPNLVSSFAANGSAYTDMTLPTIFEELDISRTTDRTRAFIKIEDGCDRFCSYCVIPYARGKVRSRSTSAIAREARICADDGHREVVLVGINLSRYGTDIGSDLADAVAAASTPDHIARVRLSSLEPELMTEELVQKLAACKKLCPHFHLSLQSGCDNTLKRMNRHYTTGEYLNILSLLRKHFPDCAITTDIMVGFAGETDDEFAQSLRFAETAGFARIHVFTYSLRPGTAAERLEGHIPDAVKSQRYKMMSELADRINARFLNAQVGACTEILVQKRTSPDFAAGLTPNYTPVRVYGSNAQKHDIVQVRIISAENGFCTAEEVP